jgi:hypothetical protein
MHPKLTWWKRLPEEQEGEARNLGDAPRVIANHLLRSPFASSQLSSRFLSRVFGAPLEFVINALSASEARESSLVRSAVSRILSGVYRSAGVTNSAEVAQRQSAAVS